MLSKNVLATLPEDPTAMWEREPLERLARERQLHAYYHHDFWQPMDTLRDKQQLDALWSSGKAPWKTWVSHAFSGRRVFLTGHTGFKGSWLALALVRMGATVRGYALDPSTEPSLFQSVGLGSLIDDVRGDIRDLDTLGRAMREFAPEVVFHLAAQPLVRRSYADPLGTYATNVMGTGNVLETIRTLPSVRAAVVVTTDKCYLNREWRWGYRETDPLGGYDPYSSSKACAEILTASLSKLLLLIRESRTALGFCWPRHGPAT